MKYLLSLLLLIIFFLMACSPELEPEAEKIDINTLRYTSGYLWFEDDYDDYIFDKSLVNEINNEFNIDSHKILVFFGVSCSCNSKETSKLPSFIKILDSAKIDSKNCEIYLMKNVTDKQPYGNIQLNTLPAFVVLKNNIPVYSINDTILAKSKDELSLEECLYEALKITF